MVTKPPALKTGDTIGIVTLGSPLAAEQIDLGIDILQKMGYKIVVGDYVYAANGFLSAGPRERASDLMKMFENPEVNMILSTRGGVGVEGILPYLDFSTISRNPKILSGYSDITILQNVLVEYANLLSFQSLMLLDFDKDIPQYNLDQFFSATSVREVPWQIENPPEILKTSLVPGNVSGMLIGGNLTSFIGTLGTPYEVDTTGRILILEETHEPANTFYRYMTHLAMARKLDDCVGIIMGECTGCEAAYGKTYDDIIQEFLVPLGKPLMTNVATAHGTYKAAIPLGATVNLNTYSNTITVMESVVLDSVI
ncbi:LD-carboxypeptidase [Chungangia koreensis]|uniref:LD-carboxypeptidase n=1 Tax=Chungangia koreensis TaxID=752657 RepID=A0ABV8X2Y8_9LACT